MRHRPWHARLVVGSAAALVGLIAAQAPPATPPNRVPPAAPAPLADPGTFDARSYGAVPGDGADDSAAIQRTVAAAARYAADPAHPAATASLVGGPYDLTAPVDLSGTRGVKVKGGPGTAVFTAGQYAGPFFTLGLPGRPGHGDRNRPVASGVYDNGLEGPGQYQRYGLAVTADLACHVPCHPLQSGRLDGGRFDTYGGGGVLVVDLYLDLTARTAGGVFMGLGDAHFAPDPWQLIDAGPGGPVCLDFTTVENDGRHRVNVPVGTGRHRLTVQLDLDRGWADVWVDRVLVPGNGIHPDWPATGRGVRPGLKLQPHGGVSPWTFGPTTGSAVYRSEDVAPSVVWGLAVGRALKYAPGSRAQRLASGRFLDDYAQFFDFGATPSAVANLPLTDAPGRPWVAVDAPGMTACGFWTPPSGVLPDTTNVSISDLAMSGRCQPPVLIGQPIGVAIERCSIKSAGQAVGTLYSGTSYPTRIDSCDLDGFDAPVYLNVSIADGSNLTLRPGRHGLRLLGNYGTWERVLVNQPPAHCEVFALLCGQDNGMAVTLRQVNFDDEAAVSLRAVVECDTAPVKAGRVTIDGLDCGILAADVPYVRLIGRPWAWHPYGLDARNLSSWSNPPAAPVVVTGSGPGWVGTFEGQPLPAAEAAAAPKAK